MTVELVGMLLLDQSLEMYQFEGDGQKFITDQSELLTELPQIISQANIIDHNKIIATYNKLIEELEYLNDEKTNTLLGIKQKEILINAIIINQNIKFQDLYDKISIIDIKISLCKELWESSDNEELKACQLKISLDDQYNSKKKLLKEQEERVKESEAQALETLQTLFTKSKILQSSYKEEIDKVTQSLQDQTNHELQEIDQKLRYYQEIYIYLLDIKRWKVEINDAQKLIIDEQGGVDQLLTACEHEYNLLKAKYLNKSNRLVGSKIDDQELEKVFNTKKISLEKEIADYCLYIGIMSDNDYNDILVTQKEMQDIKKQIKQIEETKRKYFFELQNLDQEINALNEEKKQLRNSSIVLEKSETEKQEKYLYDIKQDEEYLASLDIKINNLKENISKLRVLAVQQIHLDLLLKEQMKQSKLSDNNNKIEDNEESWEIDKDILIEQNFIGKRLTEKFEGFLLGKVETTTYIKHKSNFLEQKEELSTFPSDIESNKLKVFSLIERPLDSEMLNNYKINNFIEKIEKKSELEINQGWGRMEVPTLDNYYTKYLVRPLTAVIIDVSKKYSPLENRFIYKDNMYINDNVLKLLPTNLNKIEVYDMTIISSKVIISDYNLYEISQHYYPYINQISTCKLTEGNLRVIEYRIINYRMRYNGLKRLLSYLIGNVILYR
ncbi:MAG: hypothetical protein LN588_04470 [Rickettsia endosymbiont of Bryobia graminum]|nr:hypothetical protein [Rickettsia endosymbiont of Bryobia graminum]